MGNTEDALESETVSTKQKRIAELARIHEKLSFTSLAHHIDLRWLYEAYKRTRKDGAVGVDERTAEEYAQELGRNLRDLLERTKSGSYKAPPVRRVYIPKSTGAEQRPIGIPSFEDKVLQRAVLMVLEPIFEQLILEGVIMRLPQHTRKSVPHNKDWQLLFLEAIVVKLILKDFAFKDPCAGICVVILVLVLEEAVRHITNIFQETLSYYLLVKIGTSAIIQRVAMQEESIFPVVGKIQPTCD
jgi:hypothetical protein